jgi:hypothetical protein
MEPVGEAGVLFYRLSDDNMTLVMSEIVPFFTYPVVKALVC